MVKEILSYKMVFLKIKKNDDKFLNKKNNFKTVFKNR
jgi:hypothetical protein